MVPWNGKCGLERAVKQSEFLPIKHTVMNLKTNSSWKLLYTYYTLKRILSGSITQNFSLCFYLFCELKTSSCQYLNTLQNTICIFGKRLQLPNYSIDCFNTLNINREKKQTFPNCNQKIFTKHNALTQLKSTQKRNQLACTNS